MAPSGRPSASRKPKRLANAQHSIESGAKSAICQVQIRANMLLRANSAVKRAEDSFPKAHDDTEVPLNQLGPPFSIGGF